MPTRNAIDYTLRHFLKVAFPNIRTSVMISNDDVRAQVSDITVGFPLMSKESFLKMMEGTLPAEILESPTGHSVPAFRISGKKELYSIDNKNITLHFDLLTLSFVMLSRYEETLPSVRDTHGRFLFKNSLADKYDIIDLPIVDEYALLLRSVVKKEFPDLQIVPRKSEFISTHDIDLVSRFGNAYTNLHTLAADLLKYRSWRQFRISVSQYRACRRDELKDPYILSAEMLLERDRAAKRRSLFFLKSLRAGDEDATYDIFGTQAAHLIRTVESGGGEVGLHGSYPSIGNSSCFTKEKIYLENVTEHPITQGRQHFLRFDVKTTPTLWQNVGLTDDYTLGYAEREGFRCGTCHPFPLYDLANDIPVKVMEHPLIAMDGTFYQYQNLTPAPALQKIRQLQATCEAVEGDFILLWHNTFVWREFAPWYEEVFCEL